MTVLRAGERLAGVSKDRYSKRDVAYVVTDRTGEWVLLSQSLPRVVRYINAHVGEPWERVSVSGLHECLDRTDKRNGWHKGRWRIVSVPLARSWRSRRCALCTARRRWRGRRASARMSGRRRIGGR